MMSNVVEIISRDIAKHKLNYIISVVACIGLLFSFYNNGATIDQRNLLIIGVCAAASLILSFHENYRAAILITITSFLLYVL